MTLAVTIILGFGVILMVSSLENCPILKTFQDILSGQPIDLSGNGCNTAIDKSGIGGKPGTAGG